MVFVAPFSTYVRYVNREFALALGCQCCSIFIRNESRLRDKHMETTNDTPCPHVVPLCMKCCNGTHFPSSPLNFSCNVQNISPVAVQHICVLIENKTANYSHRTYGYVVYKPVYGVRVAVPYSQQPDINRFIV